jgi:multiple sugar transport system substrate-binding protein
MTVRPPSPRRRVVAVLVAALALAVAACTPGGSDNNDSGSKSGPVTLKLQANAVKGGKNATEASWLQDWVIPNFQKQMAGQGRQVTVQYVGTGADDEDVKTQLALDLRTGGGPDVFTPDGPWVGEFAQAGFLKPLDEVVGGEVNDWDGWSQIPKPVAGIVEFEGKRYGIPVGTDGRVLYFNKKLFAKAGLPTSWQPKSWDEVLQAGRQLKARLPGVTPIQINAGTAMGEATTAQGFIPLLFGTGKNLVEGGKWRGDTPETQAVLGFYSQLYGQGLGDPKLQLRADGRDRSFAQFADDKIAVLLEGDYFWRSVINPDGGLAPMKDRNQAVGWALIPARQPGGGLNGRDFVSMSGGAGRVINPNTKAPKEAWELLKFLNSKEALTNWVQREPRITSRTDVNQANLRDPLLSFISQRVLPITATRPGSAVYPQVSLAIQTATENVVAGRSAAAAARQLGTAVAKAVGADNVTGGS